MRGRKRKPATIKIREGNRGKRKIQNEPQPPQGKPAPPDYFTQRAKDEWQRIVGILSKMGVLTMAEAPALEMYCEAWEKYHAARERVNATDVALIIRGKDGQPEIKRNAFSTEVHKYRDACLKFLIEFGLTPVSRARIDLGKEKSDDPFEQLIKPA